MVPDLSGLSQEEAALITDVLSRLSLGTLGNGLHSPQTFQAHPQWGSSGDPDLSELDLAEQAIERELRGMPVSPSGRATDMVAGMPGFSNTAAPTPYTSQSRYAGAFSTNPAAHEEAQQAGCQAAESRHPSATGDGPSPSVAAAMNVSLQEMRERLRQQQLLHAATSAAASVGAGGVLEPKAAEASGGVPSLRASKDRTSDEREPHDDGMGGGDTARTAATAASVASTSAGAASAPKTRRSPTAAAPGDPTKAFRMLNARTNLDRYGGEPCAGDAACTSPSRAPARLPDKERSVRLQQLYERTSTWRKRCEEQHAKARQEREAQELEGCTFSPQISPASNLIMQGKPPSEVYHDISKWATPTKHLRGPPSPGRPQSACNASSFQTPRRRADAPPSGSCSSRAAAPSSFLSPGFHSNRGGRVSSTAAGSVWCGSPGAADKAPKVVVDGAKVGARLYNRAAERRFRQEERVVQQLLEEERQRRFMASSRCASPRVYNPPEPPVARHLPTGMEECTFYPSSYTGSARRPKSAPHMRGSGDTVEGPRPQRHEHAGLGCASSQARSGDGGGNRVSSVHTTISISPDLDWDEFLERQGRFLAAREEKLQSTLEQEQSTPAVPRMSPGSKKLLRERGLRESSANAGGAAAGEGGGTSAGMQGEASTLTACSSAGWQERRIRTIMEMYKECTFQPQITRKAAALPSRNVEELADGGRSRRGEWVEQQRALQQVREVEGATFKPQLTSKDAYSHVRPRINLKNPDAYLAHVAHKRRQRDAQRAELESEREALELQHCTFKPQTTPLPLYLIRRLQEQQQQQQSHDFSSPHQEPYVAWERGVGDFEADGGDMGYGGDQGYPAGYDDGQEVQLPQEHVHGDEMGYPYSIDDEAFEVPAHDLDSVHNAYQRALLFATAQSHEF